MKTMAVNIVIGAALAAGFKGVTTKAGDLVKSVGVETQAQQQRLSRIGTFRTLKKQSVAAEKSWNTAQASVGKLAREMKTVPSPTKAMTRELEAAKREAASAKRVFIQSRQSLQTLRTTMRGAGQDTKNWANQTKVLTGRLKTLEAQQRKITNLRNARQANLDRRGELRGQLFETGAMAAAVLAPVAGAIKFESAMADVRKVIDFDTPQQFKTMSNDILAMSKHLPIAASGISEIIATAGRAGIPREELKAFSEDAAKMSVAFDITPIDAASAMSGFRTNFGLELPQVVALGDSINVLDNNMDATAAGITRVLNRAGPMAKQFGLSGEATAGLAATFLAMKTPVEVSGTAMNAMFIKMKAADKQGKKFQEGLETIGWSAESLKAALEVDAQGTLLEFLDDVANTEDRIGVLTDLFGLEYADNIAAITGNVDLLRNAFGMSTDAQRTAGAMQKEFATRAATTANDLQLMKNQVFGAAIGLGDRLLPTVTIVSKVIGGMADGVSFLTNKFPLLTTVVYGGVAAMITMRLVTLASGYAWTFLKGAWIGAKLQLVSLKTIMLLTNSRMKTMNALTLVSAARFKMLAAGGFIKGFAGSLLMMARTAIPAVIVGMRALTVAMLFNPIGLAITGIAIAGALVIKYWKPVKAFFGKLWTGLRAGLSKTWTFIKKVFSWSPLAMVKAGFGTAAKFIGFAFMTPFRIVQRLWGGLKKVLSWSPGAVIRRGFVPASKFVGRVFNAPVKGVQMLWTRLKKIVSWSPKQVMASAWNALPDIFKSVLGKVKGLVKTGMKAVADYMMAPLKTVQKLWDKLKGLGKKSKQLALAVIEPLTPNVRPLRQRGNTRRNMQHSRPHTQSQVRRRAQRQPQRRMGKAIKTSVAVTGLAMTPIMPVAASPAPIVPAVTMPSPVVDVAAPQKQAQPVPKQEAAAPTTVQHIKHGDIHIHLKLSGVVGDTRAIAETLEPELRNIIRETQEGNLHG